jgi:hypothetical protein
MADHVAAVGMLAGIGVPPRLADGDVGGVGRMERGKEESGEKCQGWLHGRKMLAFLCEM